MKKSQLLGAMCACLLVIPIVAKASTVVYTDRPTFENRLGMMVIDTYDSAAYSGVTSEDISFSSALGETDYTTLVGNTDTNFRGAISGVDDGSLAYCNGCDQPFMLSFTTTSVGDASGVFGVGFEVVGHWPAPGRPSSFIYSAQVMFSDGSSTAYGLPLVDPDETDIFWGITSTLGVRHISFCYTSSCANSDTRFGLDNLTIGSSGTGIVPIPSTIYLFASGLLGLVGMARGKRKAT